jgi:hypothetical protein
LVPVIRELAAQVRDLARNPGDRGVRQRAADMDAVRRDDADLDVPTPPDAPRIPFKRQLQPRKRTGK